MIPTVDDDKPQELRKQPPAGTHSPADRIWGFVLLGAAIIFSTLNWSEYLGQWTGGGAMLASLLLAQIAVVCIAAVRLIKRIVPFATGIATLIVGAMASPAFILVAGFLILAGYSWSMSH